MNLRERLTDILDERDLFIFDIPAIKEEAKKFSLLESTQIVFKKIISELKAHEVIVTLLQLAPRIQQKYNRPLSARELQRVLEALLRAESFRGGDEDAIRQEVNALMTDEGVIQTIKAELAKKGVKFELSPAFNQLGGAPAPIPAQGHLFRSAAMLTPTPK